MRQTATEILARAGISLKTFRHGNQKVRCPKCSDARKNKREPCLSVEVGDEGCRWCCHNCGFKGGEYYERRDEPHQQHHRHGRRADERSIRNLYR